MYIDFLKKQINTLEYLNKDLNITFDLIKKYNFLFTKLDVDIFDLKSRKKNKKILSVEVGKGHDIIRPSIYKYFTELGYEVDFLLYGNKPEDRWNFFYKIKNVNYRELVGDETFLLAVLSMPIMKEYDYILFNSNSVYTSHRFDTGWDYKKLLKKLSVPDRCKYGYLTIPPHPVVYKNNDTNIQHFTSLAYNNSPMLSVSYFGDVNITQKSDKNIFLVTGNINNGQKNHDMVLDAVEELYKSGFTNFELWINGEAMKEFIVPEKLSKFVKYLGENRPETLFSILEKADFIISGIDSNDNWQKMVYSSGTCSASLMYSLGFGKPYICEDIFAKSFGLNEGNSIIYQKGKLVESLKQAINLSNEEYNKIQENLLAETNNRYKKSLIDIKKTLEKSKKRYKKRSNKYPYNNLIEFLKYLRLWFLYYLIPAKKEHYMHKIKEF